MTDLVTLAADRRRVDLETGLDQALKIRKAMRLLGYARVYKVGATLRATRFHASHEAASRLRPTGFNRAQGA